MFLEYLKSIWISYLLFFCYSNLRWMDYWNFCNQQLNCRSICSFNCVSYSN